MRQILRVRALGALVLALGLPTASAVAHVDILPTTLEVGEAQELTARVPSERDVDTVRVRITIPEEVTVFAFAPAPGWKRSEQRGTDGNVRSVEYRGGRIGPDEYADFTFLGTPFEEGEAVWPVQQVYADGVTKPWTGPPEEEGQSTEETGPSDPGPAALVRIAAAGAAPDADGGGAIAGPDEGSSPAGIWLGVIAIAIAGLSVAGVGFLWSSRPATLPGENTPREKSPAPAKRKRSRKG